MGKSGLIVGGISLFVILGSSVVLGQYCVPCIVILFGVAAGYLAGVFDKPISSGESLKKGGSAGAIAGAIGLLGGMVGGVVNSLILNPANLSSFYRVLGISGLNVSQTQIWLSQMGFAFCVGLFDIAWMALLGIAGGAVWFQFSGKNQVPTVLPPQNPLPPSIS
jgi:hypothetical protein